MWKKEETDLLLCNGKLAIGVPIGLARSEANVPLKFRIIRLSAKNALVVTICPKIQALHTKSVHPEYK